MTSFNVAEPWVLAQFSFIYHLTIWITN